jgi:hypothetical protein
MNWPSIFASPSDAVEIGYEIGRNLRYAGGGKSSENVKLHRWARDYEGGHAFIHWQSGFRAGYRGRPKPDLTF